MGFHNDVASFKQLMDLSLGDLKWTVCLAYIDDMMGRNFAEHQYRIIAVLTALEKGNLLVFPSILRRDIVKVCHNAPTGGLFGIEKTWGKLNERNLWPNAKTNVVA
jgi:hypothetical protein